MDKITDILPNEHILNFHSGSPVLPDWLLGNDLRLMIGAGDLNHDNILNIQKFSSYNVFFCLPLDYSNSLRENVEYLLLNYNKQKVICFLDSENSDHVEAFTQLFKGRFSLIDGHGGHCPHLALQNIQRLLAEGGKAMNIFEHSNNLMPLEEAEHWLETGLLECASMDYLTSRIYGDVSIDSSLLARFVNKVSDLLSISEQITVDVEINTMSIRQLQYVCRSLLFDPNMPINLTGSIRLVTKDWLNEPITEFVITKNTPDSLKTTTYIDNYVRRKGPDAYSERAYMIYKAINDELNRGIEYAKNKYTTYQRTLKNMTNLLGSHI